MTRYNWIQRSSIFAILFLILSIAAYANPVSDAIESILKVSDIPTTSKLSICIEDIETGTILYENNKDLPLIPASNLKLFTAASALHYLGADYCYKTRVYGAPIDSDRGVMESSLYLEGSGDPTFCEPYMQPTAVLDEFADKLSKMGLRRIVGNIIGDDSVFDRNFIGRGWKKDYLQADYATECGGLSLNANLIRITAYNGVYSFFPDCSIMDIVYNQDLSGKPLSFDRDPNSNRVTITGALYPDVAAGATITVHNPPLFTTSAFEKILENYGIYATGEAKLVDESPEKLSYGNYIMLCEHRSVPLLKLLKKMNKESDNLLAQHIFKTIGAEINGQGRYEYAESAVKSFLSESGVDTTGFTMADGCGLSRSNRVTTFQLTSLLTSIFKSEIKDQFIETLAHAGVDGTLKYRLTGDRVYGKTGTIDGCSSLAGYLYTANGKSLAFAIITNDHKLGSGAYKGFEDLIVDTIAKLSI